MKWFKCVSLFRTPVRLLQLRFEKRRHVCRSARVCAWMRIRAGRTQCNDRTKVVLNRYKCVSLFLALLVFVQIAAGGKNTALSAPDAETEGLYSLSDAGKYNKFVNNVDGYSMLVDKRMSVDMSYAAVRAVLENENERIEIYKQNVSGVGWNVYVNYSNKFLENKLDHHLEYKSHRTSRGWDIDIVSWSRDKLSGISNDKNHYICIEMIRANTVYTLFIKSSAPAAGLGSYAYLLDSFKTVPVTAPSWVRTSKRLNTENRGWNDETKAFYYKYFDDGAPLTWGIFEPTALRDGFGKLRQYEEYFEYEFPVILDYTNFREAYRHPKQRLVNAYKYGKTVVLSLQTSVMTDGSIEIYKILNGEYDLFLTDYAKSVADFGHPVLFRLGNEMNADWCSYSAYSTSKDTTIFTEFYRYIYGIFERAGADANTIWVWNPNGGSFPDFKWNDELMYYPGDGYVDIVGMTKYNTGTYYSSVGERWKEFNTLYDGLYQRYANIYGQPLMITEFACASMGGNKEKWVSEMFEDIKKFDRIKIAIWWNNRDYDSDGKVSRSYVLDETPELMEIFKNNLGK